MSRICTAGGPRALIFAPHTSSLTKLSVESSDLLGWADTPGTEAVSDLAHFSPVFLV